MTLAEQHAKERLLRIEAAITEFVPTWSLAPVVEALQALRGVQLINAATIMVELGDLRRFETHGLSRSGARRAFDRWDDRRLRITKAGNGRVRRALIESAWSYRYLPRTSKLKHYIHERVLPAVRDVAIKAQARLCARYRSLAGRGKKLTVAVIAIAHELAGFIWAIGRVVQAA